MSKLSDSIRDSIPYDCFSIAELKPILSGTKDSQYNLIKRAIAQKEWIHLRKGLYCLAERYRRHPLNLFVIAQKIYGPSAISFESALSYHGWIPEAVYTVASATTKRSSRFETELGVFDYVRIPLSPFFTGVDRIVADKETFFMARPWRAVLDMISAHKKEWTGIHPLLKSLRIEENMLSNTDPTELEALEKAYHSKRISRFLAGVRRDLKL